MRGLRKKRCLVGVTMAVMLGGASACASVGAWGQASDHARQGRLAEAAEAFEKIGESSSELTAAEAWYRAGILWLDRENSERSYDRALNCFRKSAAKKGLPETAGAARTWVEVLTRLNEEQRKALTAERRATRDAERLRKALRDAEKTGDALR